mgnify:CR=1 FL=1
MDLSKYDICYEHAITSWDMGLPLGNGRLGCIVYGEDAIYLAVDRIDLWDTRYIGSWILLQKSCKAV